ncbi:MAG TPA: LLM class flavin-dependent oxidoreductase [Candidatus Binatia bacterium]|jgi:alkanesulfonate monooxygenase SsuD/methylene tetrahydromethanopterin reductase-like flavin-dependent oxidoreductase (luciferase family)
MATKVKFGVALFPTEASPETIDQGRLAEKLGYDGLWVGDSHIIWRELYVILGALAAQTKKVVIGSGVTHPHVRHLTVTASAFATLEELAPGRVSIGIGIGASGPRNIGVKPVPVDKLIDGVENLRKLLRGESMPVEGKPVRLMYPARAQPPIFIAANAPRSRQAAARIADGVILGGRRDKIVGAVEMIRKAARESGRADDALQVMSWIPCSIGRDGKAAREAVKPHVARSGMVVFTGMIARGEAISDEDRSATERLNREYDFSHHMGPEHSHLVPEKWVDLFSIAGSPEQVRARIEQTVKDGANIVTIVPYGNKEAIIKEFAKSVIPAFR